MPLNCQLLEARTPAVQGAPSVSGLDTTRMNGRTTPAHMPGSHDELRELLQDQVTGWVTRSEYRNVPIRTLFDWRQASTFRLGPRGGEVGSRWPGGLVRSGAWPPVVTGIEDLEEAAGELAVQNDQPLEHVVSLVDELGRVGQRLADHVELEVHQPTHDPSPAVRRGAVQPAWGPRCCASRSAGPRSRRLAETGASRIRRDRATRSTSGWPDVSGRVRGRGQGA